MQEAGRPTGRLQPSPRPVRRKRRDGEERTERLRGEQGRLSCEEAERGQGQPWGDWKQHRAGGQETPKGGGERMAYYPHLRDEKLRLGELRSPPRGQAARRPWSRNTGRFYEAAWTPSWWPTARAAGRSRAGPRVGRPNRSPSRSPGGHLRPLSPFCPSHQPSYSCSEKRAGSCVRRPAHLPWSCSGSSLPAFLSPPPLFSGFLLHLPSGTIGSQRQNRARILRTLYPASRLAPRLHFTTRGPWWPLCLCTGSSPSPPRLEPFHSPTCNILSSLQDSQHQHPSVLSLLHERGRTTASARPGGPDPPVPPPHPRVCTHSPTQPTHRSPGPPKWLKSTPPLRARPCPSEHTLAWTCSAACPPSGPPAPRLSLSTAGSTLPKQRSLRVSSLRDTLFQRSLPTSSLSSPSSRCR